MLYFPLLLPENIKTINVISLLSKHFKQEEIDFERICDNCHRKTKLIKEAD
jgi:hypothetical protein